MTNARSLRPLALLLITGSLACGDADDDVLFAGAGGASGTSGTSNGGQPDETEDPVPGDDPPAAGAGGNAGKGGGAGKGGTAGKGGSASKGGSAGTGEAGQDGGEAGQDGGQAGQDGGEAGQDGGQAGDGGQGGNGTECAAADDCAGNDLDCDGIWTGRVPSVCPTIQAAIDVIATQNIMGKIVVAPGTYDEDIVFGGARAELTSEGGAAVTVIHGSGKGPVVTFDAKESKDSALVGFRIEGGSGTPDDQNDGTNGGGIYVRDGSPRLASLDVTKNTVTGKYGSGGGIYLEKSKSVLTDVRVFGNSAPWYGGGIDIVQGAPTLDRVTVVSNHSGSWGGGLAVYYADMTLRQSLVAKNDARSGGAMFLQGNAPTLANVALIANTAERGGAIYFSNKSKASLTNVTISQHVVGAQGEGSAFYVSDSPDIAFAYTNLFANDATPIVGLAQTPTTSSFDPQFVSLAGDPLTWDVHLKPASKLIDAGDPDVKDADGSRSDIGRWGGPPTP